MFLNTLQQYKYQLIIVGSILLLVIIMLSIWLLSTRNQRNGEEIDTSQGQLSNEQSTTIPTDIPSDYFELPTPLPDTNIPTAPPTPVPQQGDIILDGIAVNDFRETASRITEEGDVILSETPNHQIIFYQSTQEFSLVVKGDNFDTSRDEAEQIFLSQLGLDEENACRIYAQVYIPSTAQNEYAGQVLPLSFCYHEHDE